jgi:hypothetical protein
LSFTLAAQTLNNTRFLGGYSHNSSKTWSRDNPYDSGLVMCKDADHGFMEDYKTRVIKGWEDHYWHLSYKPAAEKDMMQTIISALKTRKFPKGAEYR